MRWALVFSGQGLQHPGMLPWLADDSTMQALATRCGADWRERLADSALAGDNVRAQVLLTATACAAWAQLQPLLPSPPDMVLGYSVGELAAFSAAGVFSAHTAVALAAERAAFMDQAAAGIDTGLLGITGAEAGGIAQLCRSFDLEVAIRINAGAGLVGGLRADLLSAAAEATWRGWRCTPLNIAVASHTRWMLPAAEAFDRHLTGVAMQAPHAVLFSHALGRIRSAQSARTALSQQLAQTVRWDEAMDAMAAQGVQVVLEIGPGQALARMWQERDPRHVARSADEFRSASAIAAWLARQVD